jgi:hypothetical protein
MRTREVRNEERVAPAGGEGPPLAARVNGWLPELVMGALHKNIMPHGAPARTIARPRAAARDGPWDTGGDGSQGAVQ